MLLHYCYGMTGNKTAGVGAGADLRMTRMRNLPDGRARWLARNVLVHEPALRARLSRWRLPEGLDADDVVQECYAKLAMLPDVSDIRDPRGYLFQVGRSIILMHIRRARTVSIQAVERIEDLDLAADEVSPETQISDREQLHQLAVAIAELPEPSRSAFTLRMIEGLGHRDIGERLGMSVNAVQKNLARSLTSLAIRLGRGGMASSGASKSRTVRMIKDKDAHAREGGRH